MKSWPSIRPALGLLLFLEFLFWAGAAAAWWTAKAAVPSLTLHRMEHWPILAFTGLLSLLMAGHLRWRHKAIQDLGDAGRIDSVLPGYRIFLPTWKFLLLRLAVGALVVAWLDPKMGSRLEEVEAEGVDVMVALDVSNSMLAEDVGMPRLDLAQRTIERLVSSTSGDRLGLVVFAGDAYVQCPLTTDVEAVKMFLESVDPGMVPTQGTAVGRALQTCWNGFDENSEASRVIVVLTDGENHEDDAIAAAGEVSSAGGSVHFLGLATLEGSPIPALDARGRPSGFRTDADGQPVVSRLDEVTLIEAAQAGGGTYTRASKGFVELTPLLQFKAQLETANISSVSYVDYEHHLMPWLILAAMLLLLETLLPKRVTRRILAVGICAAVATTSGPAFAQSSLENKAPLVEGTAAFLAGNHEESAADFGKGAMTPDHAALALYNQGCAYLASGDAEAAAAALSKSLELSEDRNLQEKAHYNASLSALLQGDADTAIEHAKATLRLNPTNDDARHNMALARKLQQQQEQEQQQEQSDQGDQGEQGEQGEQDEQGEQGDKGEQNDQNDQNEQNEQGDQGDQGEQGEQGEQDDKGKQGEQSDQPREGQISRADMERILESLERQEAEVQAKLRAAQAKRHGNGKKVTPEKDW